MENNGEVLGPSDNWLKLEHIKWTVIILSVQEVNMYFKKKENKEKDMKLLYVNRVTIERNVAKSFILKST